MRSSSATATYIRAASTPFRRLELLAVPDHRNMLWTGPVCSQSYIQDSANRNQTDYRHPGFRL